MFTGDKYAFNVNIRDKDNKIIKIHRFVAWLWYKQSNVTFNILILQPSNLPWLF